MLTADQHAQLPGLLRDIVDIDRRIVAQRATMSTAVPTTPDMWRQAQMLRGERARLRESARHLYGRVPLRGDTGPGRPTAVRA